MVTPVYAAALAVIDIVLSVPVINLRRTNRVSPGDAGQAELRGRVRAQGNFAEYVPPGLILLRLAEPAGAAPPLLHLAGLLLLIGRLAHAWALSGPGRFAFRTAGILMTFAALILPALLALPRAAIFWPAPTFPLAQPRRTL